MNVWTAIGFFLLGAAVGALLLGDHSQNRLCHVRSLSLTIWVTDIADVYDRGTEFDRLVS